MKATPGPASLLAAIVASGVFVVPATAQPIPTAADRFQAALPEHNPPPVGTAKVRHAPGDPLEGLNRRFYALNQVLDHAVVRPLALGYANVMPKPLRAGIRHFFTNLTEPVVFLNDLLQLRPKRALRPLGRFVINTTLGVAGLMDVAKGEKLPHRSNGFGNTLGAYGVKAGPYLYLPIFGPSDLRDLGGGTADGLVLPTVVGSPFNRTDYRVASTTLTGLDQRAEVDAELNALTESALDPYATLRSVYLQSRAAAIAAVKATGTGEVDDAAGGGAGAVALDDPLIDPGAGPQNPAPADPADARLVTEPTPAQQPDDASGRPVPATPPPDR